MAQDDTNQSEQMTMFNSNVHYALVSTRWNERKRRVAWTEQEESLLAKEEARLTMNGTPLYLTQLLAEFSGRSEDGVKGQRKKPKHQDLVHRMESVVTDKNVNNEEE